MIIEMILYLLLFFTPRTECHEFYKHKYHVTKREISCPSDKAFCRNPMNYDQTAKYRCNQDDQCPQGYNCCEDSCYWHKICKRDEENYCPADEVVCPKPQDYELTKRFLCYDDKGCRQGYACCKDSCFAHRICKDLVRRFCPEEKSCRAPLAFAQTRQYLCYVDDGCPSNYKCCGDSCYSHKICISKDSLQLESCPVEEQFCSTPSDYQQTVKYMCSDVKICPVGYMCCADSCFVHKICKKPEKLWGKILNTFTTTPFTDLTTSSEVEGASTSTIQPDYSDSESADTTSTTTLTSSSVTDATTESTSTSLSSNSISISTTVTSPSSAITTTETPSKSTTTLMSSSVNDPTTESTSTSLSSNSISISTTVTSLSSAITTTETPISSSVTIPTTSSEVEGASTSTILPDYSGSESTDTTSTTTLMSSSVTDPTTESTSTSLSLNFISISTTVTSPSSAITTTETPISSSVTILTTSSEVEGASTSTILPDYSGSESTDTASTTTLMASSVTDATSESTSTSLSSNSISISTTVTSPSSDITTTETPISSSVTILTTTEKSS